VHILAALNRLKLSAQPVIGTLWSLAYNQAPSFFSLLLLDGLQAVAGVSEEGKRLV
jgi:hypothetical protein